jgi:signal transduction histidine kinase
MRSRISSTNAHITTSWDGEVELTAAPGELRQIFSNLLANSLDAIEPGGSIRVKVSTTRNPNSGGRGGPGQLYARVTIADNGRGIPAHARAQIFEPFFTTKGAIGTGLGLWVSQQLVDKHSGSIRLRSSANPPRRGTTFCVTLPIHPSAR